MGAAAKLSKPGAGTNNHILIDKIGTRESGNGHLDIRVVVYATKTDRSPRLGLWAVGVAR